VFLGLNDSLCFFWTSSTLKVNDYVNDFMAGVNGCKCNNRCHTRQDKSRLIIKPIDDFFLLHGICVVKICNRLHH
jgi:hypothetical protein